jgi:hypothetical protein
MHPRTEPRSRRNQPPQRFPDFAGRLALAPAAPAAAASLSGARPPSWHALSAARPASRPRPGSAVAFGETQHRWHVPAPSRPSRGCGVAAGGRQHQWRGSWPESEKRTIEDEQSRRLVNQRHSFALRNTFCSGVEDSLRSCFCTLHASRCSAGVLFRG